MIANKEEERKALNKLKKIVEGLGENSYIAAAFDGCFEIAESNIENDFCCSMKQRYEREHEKAEYFRKSTSRLTDELENVKKENEILHKKVISITDLTYLSRLSDKALAECKKRQGEAAEKIVKFADNPSGEDFRKAVAEHRNYTDSIKENEKRSERLQDILQNAIKDDRPSKK